MDFFKNFVKWILNYVTATANIFFQIGDKRSEVRDIHFNVPQGFILGPVIFNIYVADLSWYEAINVKSYQYANDTTLYYHVKAPDLSNCSKTISDSIEQLSVLSKDSNLAFVDNDNTKVMILFPPQMYRVHHLDEYTPDKFINGHKLGLIKLRKLRPRKWTS